MLNQSKYFILLNNMLWLVHLFYDISRPHNIFFEFTDLYFTLTSVILLSHILFVFQHVCHSPSVFSLNQLSVIVTTFKFLLRMWKISWTGNKTRTTMWRSPSNQLELFYRISRKILWRNVIVLYCIFLKSETAIWLWLI